MISFKEKQKTVHQRLKSLRSRPTESELVAISVLDRAGIRYIFQKCFIAGDCYAIVDFYLPKPNRMVIEIDGGYHSSAQQRSYDLWRDAYLRSRGFRVVRISNDDILSNPNSLLDHIPPRQ